MVAVFTRPTTPTAVTQIFCSIRVVHGVFLL